MIDEKKEIPVRSPSKVIKITLTFLLLTLGVFLAWAAFAPLDEGAPAMGVVTVANYRKVIQHQYGGTVKEILVREGDRVTKGQILVKLEEAELKAQFAQVKAEYLSALAVYSRLQAERFFLPHIIYPREILEFKGDPEIRKVMEVQNEVFKARRAKLEAEKKIITESISGLKDYIKSLEKQKQYHKEQLNLLEKQIQSLSDLTQEGFYPRNRFIELQRQAESLKAQIAEIQANQVRAETNIREQMMRLSALEKEFLKDVESEMAEVERKLLALKDTYSAIKEKLEKTLIRSPEDGIVMNLRIHTLGGVIRPAEPILEIVPQDAELIVEAKLAPSHIENVKVGLPADLRFVALDPKETPVFTGKIFYVSPDAIRDEINYYYLLRIKLDEETLKRLKNLNKDITPGMPVVVVVKTGKRTFLSYLLKPFLDRLATAFLM